MYAVRICEADNEEDEVVISCLHFFESKDDVNDGEFEFDKNAPERMTVGLNLDYIIEEAHLASVDVEIKSDETYYTLSSEEKNCRFTNFVPEKELFDPKFKVGKMFKDIESFRKVVRNHRVVSRCNFTFRPNDDRRVQAICKLGCKWRVWAPLNKKLDCMQVKSTIPPTHASEIG
ncbi:Uncharacterized protein Adt_39276 [Abeliophyllum distichum]|uniref:Transposase MuDR plant domain-containing protein n=1 Tax=Abeliophyllum distichum TaxID=126358 RepID=A0ABD1Q4N5_9LAMI